MRFVRDHTGPFGHLPDGRRIFLNGEIFSRPYVIPNPEIEQRLRLRIKISFSFSFAIAVVSVFLFMIAYGQGDWRLILLFSCLIGIVAGSLHVIFTRGILQTLDRLETRITVREYCLEIEVDPIRRTIFSPT